MKVDDNVFPKLIVAEGAAPATPSSGDQTLYLDTADHHLKRKNSAGSVVDIEAGASGGLYSAYVLVRDEKSQNTNGGTSATGGWQTRDLNTLAADTGSHASLAANQITLDAGTYRCEISCPAFAATAHQARLRDTTGGTTLVEGQIAYAYAVNLGSTAARVAGRFTLAVASVLEVQHQVQAGNATNGWGVACNFGTEVYTVAEFWKES